MPWYLKRFWFLAGQPAEGGQETRAMSWLNTEQWRGRSGDSAFSLSGAKSDKKDSQDARQSQQSWSFLLFHSTPFLFSLLTSAPETTRLCCKTAHLLASQSIWPSSISSSATQDTIHNSFTTRARSHDPAVIAASISHIHDQGRGERRSMYKPADENS